VLTAEWFVGIDWAADVHEVCVVDRDGHVTARRQVPHTAAALQALVDALLARAGGESARIAIGLEVPRGALVELCVERGFAVYAINPKQVDRFRDRFTVAGAKDDSRDAQVIADSLRTDPHAFRRVRLDHPLVIQLREWARLDDELGVELGRLTNQLRDLVYRATPGLLTLCPAADEPWFWGLLREAPTPTAQRRLTLRRVERLLRDHRIRRLQAPQVREVLQAPVVYTAPGVVEAVAAHVALLLPRLELVATQRRAAARELERLLDVLAAEPVGDQREHADVAIVRSMPGVGTRVAARMLAEASQPLADRAYHVLRVWAGVAPVTKQSGRRRRPTVGMRYACNRRLREATYHWARTGAQQDAATRAYYAHLRARGHSHGRALRSVADRLLRILVTLLSRGELFDPLHGQRLPVHGTAAA
jgi:transposase